MNPAIYNEVQREYDIKRQKAINEADKRKNELLERLPKYKELQDKKNSLAIELARTMIVSSGVDKQIAEENMQIKLKEIENDICALMVSEGLTEDYVLPRFECSKCQDTGYVKYGDKVSRCSCFTQKIVNVTYKQNNMLKLDEENFNTFDIAFFPAKPDKEKYQSDKSPLENICEIKKIAMAFVENINNPKQKNLLFVGRAGTGKTFMSSCIAHAAVNKGHAVLYQTAPLLMDMY